jgi:CRISPR-associated protein Cmr5
MSKNKYQNKQKHPSEPSVATPPERPTKNIPGSSPQRSSPPQTSVKSRDLDRCRAEAAWKAIEGIAATDKEYGSLAREMPTLIQVNGLAQTLAFLRAKNKTHHQSIFNHLSGWVCQHLGLQGNLLESVLQMDSQLYRRATAESLAFLQWLKRFSEAKIEKSEDKSR